MTHPAFQIGTNYFVQQYSNNEIRFADESTHKVIEQVWEGSKILSTNKE